jgi:hypothetical protein
MLSRRLLATLALAALLVTGCGSPTSRLIGKWEADMSSVLGDVQAEAEKSGNPLAGAFAGLFADFKVEAEFKSDGTCMMTGSFMGASGSGGGKWRYLKSEGDTLVLMVKYDQGGEEKEFRVKFISNDEFELTGANDTGGQQMVPFKRVAAK